MNNPLGVSTSLFGTLLGWDAPETCLGALAGTPIRHFEYMCVDDEASRYRDDNHIARVVAMMDAHSLSAWSVHAPFWAADISAPEEPRRREALETAMRAMDIAQALKAGIVVIHGSREPVHDDERHGRLVTCLRSLNELCKRASQRGLLLALEMLPRSCLGNRVGEMRWLLDLVDGDLRVCFDVNHVTLYEDVGEALRALADRIVTLHISDNDGVDERHWIPGRGAVNWRGFSQGLGEIAYSGCLMHEAVDKEVSVEENLALVQAAAKEKLGWSAGP